MAGRSIVEYFAEHEGYKCGYCGNTDTNYSHGMWAHVLTNQDYQDLIDRGWRRSGCYLYKPTMDVTCCPHYPIRCNALEFKLSKSQKKVIKRVNRFLKTGIRPNRTETGESRENQESSATSSFDSHKEVIPGVDKSGSDIDIDDVKEVHSQSSSAVNLESVNLSQADGDSNSSNHKEMLEPGFENPVERNCDQNKSNHETTKKTPRPGEGADPNKPKCKKAKLVRLERKREKQPNASLSKNKLKESQEKSLEDFLNDVGENPKHKLEVKTLRSSPPCPEFESSIDDSHAVYFKYQLTIHNDLPTKPVMKQWTRFLVNSPLQTEDDEEEQEEQAWPGHGSFHQHYLLDGKLIAVGVLDILPNCTSSVYLYYDPDYHFLSLGTYSALRELAFTRHLHSLNPEIQYYYMGYYIHSCVKMRYKGQYYPSFLNCPETYTWIPIEESRKKLDVAKYSRLATADKVEQDGDINLDKVLVLYQRQAMPYMLYKVLKPHATDEEQVMQYAQLAGKTCAERMLLYRK